MPPRSQVRQHTPSSASSGQKPRFGLPQGFVPNFRRNSRSVLLEGNVYRLPDGKEFVPSPPSGTLAAGRHVYALLTIEQFGRGERGSVYIRLDGRVFDYSNIGDPDREMFDTGYTIDDLVRTGRYASRFSSPAGAVTDGPA